MSRRGQVSPHEYAMQKRRAVLAECCVYFLTIGLLVGVAILGWQKWVLENAYYKAEAVMNGDPELRNFTQINEMNEFLVFYRVLVDFNFTAEDGKDYMGEDTITIGTNLQQAQEFISTHQNGQLTYIWYARENPAEESYLLDPFPLLVKQNNDLKLGLIFMGLFGAVALLTSLTMLYIRYFTTKNPCG